MNNVILIGRVTRDPDVRYTQGENSSCVARFTLAVDRRTKDKKADFISCIAFGKQGEFVEKYAKKGIKFALEGRIQTGSYERDGQKVYTTDVVAESMEFVESKGSAAEAGSSTKAPELGPADANGFMQIPDGIDEELPFN